MRLASIGDSVVNLELITHVDFNSVPAIAYFVGGETLRVDAEEMLEELAVAHSDLCSCTFDGAKNYLRRGLARSKLKLIRDEP